MMDHDLPWKDNGSGELQQYDFSPPAEWTVDRIAAAQLAMAGMLEGAQAATTEPGWLRLALRLPAGLRTALIAELRAGNQLAGIGSTGWPDTGSIVANLRDRFSTARQSPPEGVRWRELDDPHYAREELSQKHGTTEFLVIS